MCILVGFSLGALVSVFFKPGSLHTQTHGAFALCSRFEVAVAELCHEEHLSKCVFSGELEVHATLVIESDSPSALFQEEPNTFF